jgi:hypothetical protein
MDRKFWFDVAERAGWTLAQAAVGFATVEVAGVDVWWAVPVASGLSVLKGIVAKHVGKSDAALPSAE